MRRFSPRARIILAAAAGLLLLGNVWWLTRRPAGEVQQFSLRAIPAPPDMKPLMVRLDPATPVLVFDPRNGHWTIRGKPVRTIAPFVRTDGNGPLLRGSYLVMAIRPPATIAAARAAFNALFDENICQAGFFQAADRNGSVPASAMILRIEWVLGPHGQRRNCPAPVRSPA